MATPDYDRDAYAIIQSTLAKYGLGGKALSDWIIQSLKNDNPIEQVLLQLEDRPEFKAAFPEIEARRKREAETGIRLQPIGPAEILAWRSGAKAMMRTYGLPEEFFNNNADFQNMIVNDVSLEELNSRLDAVSTRVANAPPQIRQVFGEIFGAQTDRALFLAATNVNTALPVLENMVRQAEAGGAARRLGFSLTQPEMQRVAGLNITYDQAVEGFGELDEQRQLFNETLYETEDFTVGDEGLAAAFRLEDGQELRRRGEARAAETSGGGGAGSEQRGVTGLGSAGKL
jgi:hypothetical protein